MNQTIGAGACGLRLCAGRRRISGSLVFLTLLLCWVSHTAAQSLFSREGIGEWFEGYDLRGEALGGTGIGTIDPYNFSAVNPAATAFGSKALGYVGLVGSLNWTEDGQATIRQSAGRIAGLGAFVPLGSRFGARFSLRPRTDCSYVLTERIDTGSGADDNIHRSEGSRGVLLYAADLSWRAGRALACGLKIGVQTGSLRDEGAHDFTDSGWVSTQDRRTLRFRPAWTFGAGVQWSPQERLGLGAVVSLDTSTTLEETYRSAGEAEWTHETDMDDGLARGDRAPVHRHPRLRLSADLLWRKWEDVRLTGDLPPQSAIGFFRNTTRWGIGLERVPRLGHGRSALDRMAFRVGFAWVPWYLRVGEDRNGVNEGRVTAGIGIPIRQDRGRVDLLMAYGRRGSLAETGIAEEYVRIGFACAFASMVREY